MMKTLLLVDGSSYLYRAFHGLPDLRNAHGEPTGALYGYITMLRRLALDVPADYRAVVFDAKGKTFRDDIYPEYKAQRAPMPEDLARQIAPIHAVVTALGWPILMVPGVEADDVIGTLAVQATRENLATVVSTGDKDLAQLVNDHVTLVNTMSNEKLDVAGVQNKFGVPPELIVDYLTLMGDAVDNVPGVEKVGPKTAVKWLQQYGTLDAVVQHAGEIGGVVGENLRKALDWLPQARHLLTVKCDCDLNDFVRDFHAELTPRAEDRDSLQAIFEHNGFKTMLKELSSGSTLPQAPSFQRTRENKAEGRSFEERPSIVDAHMDSRVRGNDVYASSELLEKKYHCVTTQAALDDLLQRLNAAELTAFDTETTALDAMQAQLVGLSFAFAPGEGWYLPVGHHYAGCPDQLPLAHVLEQLKPWFADASKPKVGQHLKYDIHILQNYGVVVRGVAHDTLLQSYVLESHRSHDMDSLALRHLNRTTIKYDDVTGKGAQRINFSQVAIETATDYAAEDAEVTLHLHQTLWPQIEADEKLRHVYQDIELPVAQVLQVIERNGVLIDAQLLEKQSHELGKRLLEIEQQVVAQAGQPFNLNSPKQLGEILFDKLQLPVVKKTASGAPSTDEEVLQKLAEDYPLPKLLLDYRGMAKLKSTYTDKLPKMVNPKTGRVHTNYAQAVAVTGRLASNDPNLQNIPVRTAEGRRIREAFIAGPGNKIVSADYSQIELRIMAHMSGDASLLRAFAAGEDIHRATAAEVFGVTPLEVDNDQRRVAKVINFGLIYGMSAFGLASNLGIERDAAKLYIDRYFARYPGVAGYMDETKMAAKSQGYVETAFGRRLWLPEINSPNGQRRQGAERAAINAPMQGTAADLIKLAMIATQQWLTQEKMHTRLIMQVHDELVLEVPGDELAAVHQHLPDLMCNVAQLKVPLLVEVGVGDNWDQAH